MSNSSYAQELTDLLGKRFSQQDDVCLEHGTDESSHPPCPPDGVCFPQSTEDVVNIVNICRRHEVPIVPYGRGTSVEGAVVATRGGVCIDMQQMNQILSVHQADLDAHVQAGVTQLQLNEALNGSDLFFSVDPGAEATLGGMASTRASGTNAVRYGTMRENVLGLKVVLADGRVINTARRARKSSAGYDLTRLFVGAEGTLGVITEVTVRLYRRPLALASAVCPFATVEQAVDTVIATIQNGIPLARVELLDEVAMQAVNDYCDLTYARSPTLFFEFQGGSEQAVAEQSEAVRRLADQCGGGDFQWATEESQRNQLWHARHQAYYAMLALRPGARSLTTDVCVPISRLADCIAETKEDLAGAPFPAPLLGHVGDGNFHILFLVDPDNEADLRQAETLNHRIVERALAMDGTCTGEHGVGLGKIDFLPLEFGDALDVMKQVKRALDPENLMNPGKVFQL